MNIGLMVRKILKQRRLDTYVDWRVLCRHHEGSPASHRHYMQLAAYVCDSSCARSRLKCIQIRRCSGTRSLMSYDSARQYSQNAALVRWDWEKIRRGGKKCTLSSSDTTINSLVAVTRRERCRSSVLPRPDMVCLTHYVTEYQ